MDINWDELTTKAIEYSPKIVMAILVLIIGWKIASFVSKLIQKALAKQDIDESIQKFLGSMLSALLKIMVVLTAAGILGAQTSSFVAVLAAAGFAVGMALQGSLSNFAAGVMVLLFKPYKVGDIIEVSGSKGKVKEIQIFNTIIQTPKNETVIIPNSLAVGDKIINSSTVGNVRVDLMTHMPYEEDLAKVREAIMEEVLKHPKILKDPAPSVDIEAYDSHNLTVGVFVFCLPEDYWTVYYSLNNAMKTSLGRSGVKVAYSEGVELGSISQN